MLYWWTFSHYFGLDLEVYVQDTFLRGKMVALLMDFFQLLWLRSTSLYPRHLQEGNKNFYLQNWLSLVLTTKTALEALVAVLMDFFQLLWLRSTSLCLRHLLEVKENLSSKVALIGFNLKNSLIASGGWRFGLFSLKTTISYLRELLSWYLLKKSIVGYLMLSLVIVGNLSRVHTHNHQHPIQNILQLKLYWNIFNIIYKCHIF